MKHIECYFILAIFYGFSYSLKLTRSSGKYHHRLFTGKTNVIVDLVLEYLSASGFSETELALRKEVKLGKRKVSTSRLEILMDTIYERDTGSSSSFSSSTREKKQTLDTELVSYNPCGNDPHGSSVMPIYQTATFCQPSLATFGDYDYTRSGNPTRDALQRQLATLDRGAQAFCFTTGMAALAAVTQLLQSGDEVIINDDSYGGTYRLMSQVVARRGIRVRYCLLSTVYCVLSTAPCILFT